MAHLDLSILLLLQQIKHAGNEILVSQNKVVFRHYRLVRTTFLVSGKWTVFVLSTRCYGKVLPALVSRFLVGIVSD